MIVMGFRAARAFLASVGLLVVGCIATGVVMQQREKRRRG